ncbi:MAG: nucleotide exchange factor GrpE, partial [Nitrospinaceae bacterium]|nr:nucleotide exchange factor GrpE [Nitrospinaceae bacterium]NIR56018.1 nucleotide exchange factor GrpE [Nitrospinaceae bacterium]NIS86462.1 nucleotide exchange factor GrpE [Nitrospinaceae bacterium]NIT83297.1 nucleotide exchange factor GrpE [Nitrospinaceae bacterium]NIU45507.1 nucleotide exchange factor GrpE [Nitrospinaceae bacterium]
LRQGVEMILKQFDAFLEKEKVVPMKAVGEPFDPTIHEVLCQEPSNQHQENTITQEYSKGYFYNGRVLRPAKVVIAKSSSGSDEKAPEEESPEESEKDS